MSPPDPVLAIQQKAASLRMKTNDSREQIHPRDEKAKSMANGSGEAQDGAPENRQGISQGSIV